MPGSSSSGFDSRSLIPKSNKTIIMVGAGGHALSCLDVLESCADFEVVGLIGKEEELGAKVGGYQVLFTDQDFKKCVSIYHNFHISIGHIKSPEIRKRIFIEILGLGGRFPSIVSNRAYVSPKAQIGDGTIIHHGAIVNSGAIIGVNSIINSGSIIEHGVKIGDHCHVSTGAKVNGNVEVGNESFIGSGAVIKHDIKIGSNSVIGMSATVKVNLLDGAWVNTGVIKK